MVVFWGYSTPTSSIFRVVNKQGEESGIKTGNHRSIEKGRISQTDKPIGMGSGGC